MYMYMCMVCVCGECIALYCFMIGNVAGLVGLHWHSVECELNKGDTMYFMNTSTRYLR